MSAVAPSRAPIVLSAFVLPGLGQFAQRRWLAGALVSGLFLSLFTFALLNLFSVLGQFYRMAFDLSATPSDRIVHRGLALGIAGAGGAILVYVIGVLDAYLAYLRARSAWAARRFLVEVDATP